MTEQILVADIYITYTVAMKYYLCLIPNGLLCRYSNSHWSYVTSTPIWQVCSTV